MNNAHTLPEVESSNALQSACYGEGVIFYITKRIILAFLEIN